MVNNWRRTSLFLVIVILSAIAAARLAMRTSGARSLPTQAVTNGVAIGFTLEADNMARFTLTDESTGENLSGLRPLAWMDRQHQNGPLDEKACKIRIRERLSGALSGGADVDLNSYLLLTLNHDHTISVINPQTSFSRSKLQKLITLPGYAADWALLPGGERLAATIPGSRSLVLVDVRRGRVARNIDVGSEPRRIAVSSDGQTAWVGNDGSGSVSLIDLEPAAARGQVTVGKGSIELILAQKGKTLWAVGEKESSLVVVDTLTLAVKRRLSINPGVVALSESSLAAAVYGANERTGELLIIPQDEDRAPSRLELAPGISKLAVDPSGRWLFVLNSRLGNAAVIDTVKGKIAHTVTDLSEPTAIVFTRQYAYLHNSGSTELVLVRLQGLERTDAIEVVRVQAGQNRPNSVDKPAVGHPLVATPEDNGVIIAQSADRALYHYVEGLMAPATTHGNYSRSPRAILLANRSLTESSPGVYETGITLPVDGPFDVAFLLQNPQAHACFTFGGNRSGGTNVKIADKLKLNARFDLSKALASAKKAELSFAIESSDGGFMEPVGTLSVLIFHAPAGRQWRLTPPVRADGTFSVSFLPEDAGQYKLFAQFHRSPREIIDLPVVDLHVKEEDEGAKAVDEVKPGSESVRDEDSNTVLKRQIPDVELLDQDGQQVRLLSEVIQNKIIAINFIFTSCNMICTPMGAAFAGVQKILDADPDMRLISISIDPLHDTPDRLRAYASKFNGGPSWRLLTGDLVNIQQVARVFGIDLRSKDTHSPFVIIGNSVDHHWERINGLANANQLATVMRNFKKMGLAKAQGKKL